MDDDEIPGLEEFIASEGIIDSPVNRKVYRMCWLMTRTFNDAVSGHLEIKRLYSAQLNHWLMWICWTIPSGLSVPIAMFSQEEVFIALKMGCGDPDCDGSCVKSQSPVEASGVQPSQPKPLVAETNSIFTHTVESLTTDPQLDETFRQLNELFIDNTEERREGDGQTD